MTKCNKKLKTKLKQNQFYCVVCCTRKTVSAINMCVKEYKNHRAKHGYTPTLKSHCNTCGTPLTKFIKYNDTDRLTDKYGSC